MLSDEIKRLEIKGFDEILRRIESQEKLMKEMYSYITFYYQNIYVEDDGEYWDNAENIIKQYESICKEL